jgi:catechol 2,3-dioxygenase
MRDIVDFGIRPPGFRLPDDTTLGTVRLQVGDLTRSLEYYERVLGLRGKRDDEGVARLVVPDDGRVLLELHERPGARPVPRRGLLGLFHFAILLPDRKALGSFVNHLPTLRAPVGMSDHAVSEAIYLSDPDGLGIEVYADRARRAWRKDSTGQLMMTTEPLDLESVRAAAGATPWTGMPPGSVMGHVHLHVGSLESAEAFYHRALGFDKTVWTYPGALFMSAGGYHHHLGTNTWSQGGPPSADHAQLLSWDIVVADRERASAAAASLETSGYVVERSDDALVVADPWATRLRVVA